MHKQQNPKAPTLKANSGWGPQPAGPHGPVTPPTPGHFLFAAVDGRRTATGHPPDPPRPHWPGPQPPPRLSSASRWLFAVSSCLGGALPAVPSARRAWPLTSGQGVALSLQPDMSAAGPQPHSLLSPPGASRNLFSLFFGWGLSPIGIGGLWGQGLHLPVTSSEPKEQQVHRRGYWVHKCFPHLLAASPEGRPRGHPGGGLTSEQRPHPLPKHTSPLFTALCISFILGNKG